MKQPFTPIEDSSTGGIRVEEYGLIEILEDSELIWGLHNRIVTRNHVPKGYLFNSLDIVGSWHDVLPKYSSNGKYFKCIGDSINAVKIVAMNRKLKKGLE